MATTTPNPRGLAAILAVTALVACHQDDHNVSRNKSLDNAAAQAGGHALAENSCGPTFSDPASLAALAPVQQQKITAMTAVVEAPDQPTKLAALSALAAAPARLLKVVFDLLHAKVVVPATPAAAAALCSGVLSDVLAAPELKDLNAGQTELTTCWLPPKGDDPVRLVLPPDAAKIRANMLQLVAFTYTEYLVTRLGSPSAPAPFNADPWPAAIAAFHANNAQLASTFLAEVKDQKAHDQLAGLAAANAASFGFLVYANAVDSYYCSTHSRELFGSQFANTLRVFAQVNDLGEQ